MKEIRHLKTMKNKRNFNIKWLLLQSDQNADTTLLHSHDELYFRRYHDGYSYVGVKLQLTQIKLLGSGVARTFGARGQQTLRGPRPSFLFSLSSFSPFSLSLGAPVSSGAPGHCPPMPPTRYATASRTQYIKLTGALLPGRPASSAVTSTEDAG